MHPAIGWSWIIGPDGPNNPESPQCASPLAGHLAVYDVRHMTTLPTFRTMHLWVTHGIFSRGLDSLLTTGDGSFNTIGCSDSFTPFCDPCEQLVIVPVSRAIEVASIL